MIFKSRVDLGLQVLHHLKAATDKTQRMTVAQLAEKTDKSLSFIEQTMTVLKGMGLVESLRGPGGGYVLTHVQYRYAYQAKSIESFGVGFYPDDAYPDHLINDFAMMRLSAVIG